MKKLPVQNFNFMKSEQSIEPTIEMEERGWLDLTGTAVSWICAVHCLALPFFISLLPLVGLSFLLDETVERTIIGVSILIAAASLLPAYFRQHRKIRAFVLFLAGIGLIIASHLYFEKKPVLQVPFLLAGAGLITAAHLVNRHLRRTCPRCESVESQANC